MGSKIGKGEWIALYAVTGAIDVAQFFLALFGVPLTAFLFGAFIVGASEAADPFIGGALVIWLQLRGVSVITRFNRLASLIGATGIEEITGGSAPFWIADIWYIHRDVRKEQLAGKQAAEQGMAESALSQAAYQGGRREPQPDQASAGPASRNPNMRPLVSDGMRRPR